MTETEYDRMTSYSFRLPSSLLQRMRDAHAETYAQHRLSMSEWVRKIIEDAIEGKSKP